MVTVPAPDQNPDNPKNGPPEPGSACPWAEMSKSPDAITAFLRQLAEGFKEKTAMNLPFESRSQSCRGPAIVATLPRVAPCRCVGRADTHDLYLRIHFIFNWIYCEPSAEITFSFESSGLTFT